MMRLHFPLAILISVLTFICILIAVPASQGDDDEKYTACSSPYNYKCGPLSVNVSYPFWANGTRPQYCGHHEFKLKCENDEFPTSQIGVQVFRVLGINETHQIMKIARPDILNDFCIQIFPETNISSRFFRYSENVRNLSIFYECRDEFSSQQDKNKFRCSVEYGKFINAFYTMDNYDKSQLRNLSNSCSRVIKVPFQETSENFDYLMEGKLNEVMKQGFEVRYQADNMLCSACNSSKGICGSNPDLNEFSCLCRDQPQSYTCSIPGGVPIEAPSGAMFPGGVPIEAPSGAMFPENESNLRLKLFIGLGAATMGITTVCVIICVFRWKKKLLMLTTACCSKVTKSDQDLEAFIRNYGPLALKRYSFSNVKKMTNSFKDELGQGGYGCVYKGKLSDGRLVAVKLLNTSKGNGQEFINEVASISRTSHVNIVALLGFCLEGSKRALIYEFMPNGSLEKFVYNRDASKPKQHLGWEKMHEIVIAIAKGLEYLHRGCNTRILHFDIKPHNILLDQDFCPKISDFGLAKLCLKKESIVSMSEARGTIGYIAPEVFSRNFGEVSHKSDVYSYGMMIMELVGCKNDLNTETDQSSDIYFPHWIYKHFERNNEFKVPGTVSSEENEIAKNMTVVGLWCIQTRPSDRPAMNSVIEMLQSNTDALKIPPKPFESSPPRSPIDFSIISTSWHNDKK